MKVIMNHSENSGVSYYRMWMQSKNLKKIGWDVQDFADNPPVITVDQWEEMCAGADIFVTQRSDNPQLLALLMAIREQFNVPLVFEIDDDIYDISKNSPAYNYFHPGSPFIEMTEMVMKHVDAITVSTEALADRYRKLNKNVYILPNAQDLDDWKGLKTKTNKDELIIGWAGSATHYDDLKLVWRPMKKLLKKYPHVKFRVLGCLPDFLAGHPQVELRSDWAPIRQWQSKLASLNFDIGLVPVVERPFNRGKSNIKWQEYAMLGIPTVATRFGEYKQINNGVDGLLATNDEYSWEANIEKLIKDADLRRIIGSNAKKRVLADFDIAKNITQWDSVYKEVIKNFRANSED